MQPGELTTTSSSKNRNPPMRPPPPLVAQSTTVPIAAKRSAFDDLDDTIRIAFSNSPKKQLNGTAIGGGGIASGLCTSSFPSNHEQPHALPCYIGGSNYGTQQQLCSSSPSILTQGVLLNTKKKPKFLFLLFVMSRFLCLFLLFILLLFFVIYSYFMKNISL